jgi:hypothetical protein
MPIVFVHGVAQRSEAVFAGVEPFLERYVAPAINPNGKVECRFAFWGDLGVKFAWNGASRPKDAITGQGADDSLTTIYLAASARQTNVAGLAGVIGTATNKPANESEAVNRAVLKRMDQVDTAKVQMPADPLSYLDASMAEEIIRSTDAVAGAGFAAAGFDELRDRVDESLARVREGGGWAVTRILGPLRRPINDAITLFIGDVFVYLQHRLDVKVCDEFGPVPGPIPMRVLDVLREAVESAPNEPLIVLTHSMGGQIVYDIATTFLPVQRERDKRWKGVRIACWGAAASQVGLFEEMKAFSSSSTAYSAASRNTAPLPGVENLGYWWNVWDRNDYLSYTAASIFSGDRFKDHEYNGGTSIIDAHGAYLVRPSFYKQFAVVVEESLRNHA